MKRGYRFDLIIMIMIKIGRSMDTINVDHDNQSTNVDHNWFIPSITEKIIERERETSAWLKTI